MMNLNKFIFLKCVLLFLCILLLEACGQNKNIATKNKLEPFNFNQRDTNASIIGRWKLYETVEYGVQILNKYDLNRMIENQVYFMLKIDKVNVNKEDSLLIAENAKKLLEKIDKFYLEFYPDGKIEGGFVYITHLNSLVKYKSIGRYEMSGGGKITFDLPIGEHIDGCLGVKDWAIYKNQLRLYDNDWDDFAEIDVINETRYRTFYKE